MFWDKTPTIPEEELETSLIIGIIVKIAEEKRRSPEKVAKQLLTKRNKAIIRRFWEILDDIIPEHNYQYVGSCPECGELELCEELPELAKI